MWAGQLQTNGTPAYKAAGMDEKPTESHDSVMVDLVVMQARSCVHLVVSRKHWFALIPASATIALPTRRWKHTPDPRFAYLHAHAYTLTHWRLLLGSPLLLLLT